MEYPVCNKIKVLELFREENLIEVNGPPRSRKGTTCLRFGCDLLSQGDIDNIIWHDKNKNAITGNTETYEDYLKNYEHQLIAFVSDASLCNDFPGDSLPYFIRSLIHEAECDRDTEVPDHFYKRHQDENFTISRLERLAEKEGYRPSAIARGAVKYNLKNGNKFILMTTYDKAKLTLEQLGLPTDNSLIMFDEGRHSEILEQGFNWSLRGTEGTPEDLLNNLITTLRDIDIGKVEPLNRMSPDKVREVEHIINNIARLLEDAGNQFGIAYRFQAFEKSVLKGKDAEALIDHDTELENSPFKLKPMDKNRFRNYLEGLIEESSHDLVRFNQKTLSDLLGLKSELNNGIREGEILTIWDLMKKRISYPDNSKAGILCHDIRDEIKDIGESFSPSGSLIRVYKALTLAKELSKDETELKIDYTETKKGTPLTEIKVKNSNDDLRNKWKENSAGLIYIDATPPPSTNLMDGKQLGYGFSDKEISKLTVKANDNIGNLKIVLENRRRNYQSLGLNHLEKIVEEAKKASGKDGVFIFSRSKAEKEKILESSIDLPEDRIDYFRSDKSEGWNIEADTIIVTGIPYQNIHAAKNKRSELAKVAKGNLPDIEEEYAKTKAYQELIQGGMRHINEGESNLIIMGAKEEALQEIKRLFPAYKEPIEEDYTIRKLRKDDPNNNVTAEEKAGRLRLILNQDKYKEDFLSPDSIWRERLLEWDLQPIHYFLLDLIAKSEPINKGKVKASVNKGTMNDRDNALEELENREIIESEEIGDFQPSIKYSIKWKGTKLLRELEAKQ